MIAVIEHDSRKSPCLVHTVGRRGLSVQAFSWCGQKFAMASYDVTQAPDGTVLCSACKEALSRGAPVQPR
jgi:hypothetical protein